MLKKESDSIESFFRKASLSYDQNFNEEDWRKMEKMLDEEMEKTPAIISRRKLMVGVATLVLVGLLSIIVYVSVRNDRAEKKDIERSANQKLSEKHTEKNPAGYEDQIPEIDETTSRGSENLYQSGDTIIQKQLGERKNDQLNNTAISKDEIDNIQSKNGKSTPQSVKRSSSSNLGDQIQRQVSSKSGRGKSMDDKDSGSREEKVVKNRTAARQVNGNQSVSSDENSTDKQHSTDESQEVKVREAVPALGHKAQYDQGDQDDLSLIQEQNGRVDSGKQNERNAKEETTREWETSYKEVVKTESDSLPVLPDSVSEEVKPPVEVLDEEVCEDEEERAEWPPSRWSVSAIVAPDFSRTTSSGYTSPGNAYGLLVNYHFLNRWIVSTGIVHNYKIYASNGDEYTPPAGYWAKKTNGLVPEKVDGNCVVLEVPLLLSYKAVETKRSRVSAIVGVSSYFMLNQNYTYTFESENPGAATGWHTDKDASYTFSIGTLSARYEYLLRPSLSLGVEPYYKIPFGTIGWGGVTLYSTGVMFIASYRFPDKK